MVRVRVDGASALKRGDRALIVAWDKEREAFTVEAMSDVLAEKEEAAKKSGDSRRS